MSQPPNIVCLGEILWDLLPTGPQLGGAPSNLACHVASLGGIATILSRVGNDDLGHKALALLRARGVQVDLVGVDSKVPTGTAGVELTSDGQPRFFIQEKVAWDRLTADERSRTAVAQAHAVCFGSLGQRTPEARAAIISLLAAASPTSTLLFDINLRAPFYDRSTLEASLKACRVLKLNDGELDVLTHLFDLPGTGDVRAVELARRFDIETVLLTLGADGSRLWSENRWFQEPGRRVEVRDTVGAGDSFTAAYVIGRMKGWSPEKILRTASDVAAFVCTQSGATPDLPDNLTAPFRS